MFKQIQTLVNDLEDYIREQTNFVKDDSFVLTTYLIGECGEVAEMVKRLEGKTTKQMSKEYINDLAKEIVDVIVNVLRIARYYDIDLDNYFLNRLEKIKRKFSTLEKPEKITCIKDRETLRQYREHQYGSTYSRPLTHEHDEYQVLLGKTKLGKMLDYCCGDGSLKKYFEEKGWEAYGCDWSWHALSQASEMSLKNLVFAPVESLPYEDNFFDFVTSRRTLHTNPKEIRTKAIKEVARVLKKGGVFICSVQNISDEPTLKKYKKNGVELKDDKNSYVVDVVISGKKNQRMKHFFTIDELKREIEVGTGLEVVSDSEVTSRAGWCRDDQKYLTVKAIKK